MSSTITYTTRPTRRVRRALRRREMPVVKDRKYWKAFHQRWLLEQAEQQPFYDFVFSLHGVITDRKSQEYQTWKSTHPGYGLLGPRKVVKCDLGHECRSCGNVWTCYECRFIFIDL